MEHPCDKLVSFKEKQRVVSKYINKPSLGELLVTDDIRTEYDYVIVGGGSAGSVIAARLAEDANNRILLLEAGNHFDKDENIHVPGQAFSFLPTDFAWQFKSETEDGSFQGLKEKKTIMNKGKVLGGSSSINACFYARGSSFDFNEWVTKYGCIGWGYADLLPYFKKAEDIKVPDLKTPDYHGSGGPIAVSDSYRTHVWTLENKWGTPRQIIMVHHKLDLVGHKLRVRRDVILSAGAIKSPQLFLLSGIGPRKHLEDLDIPLIKDLPVGQRLDDHVSVILNAKINQSIGLVPENFRGVWPKIQYALFGSGVYTAITEGTSFMHFDNSKLNNKRPDIQFLLQPFFVGDNNILNYNDNTAADLINRYQDIYGVSVAIVLLHPKSTGTVRLQGIDPFDSPLLDTNILNDQRDVDGLLAGIRMFDEFISTQAMQELGADLSINKASFCSQHEFRSDDFWRCMIRHIATNINHSTSTCKMGKKDNSTSVVDPDLKVKGTRPITEGIMLKKYVTVGGESAGSVIADTLAGSAFVRGVTSETKNGIFHGHQEQRKS
ncbi:glucose dehydrogenase [FAD, quinone]-like [Ruditapes philippinarum]|uniref:glucose dehydrogenase [FAD, quinone]-like n=1 Tax=Ruditapes philippinarum TaxID=129788 RepID=UPI00295B83D9|nr:glucose dehydrogenase [FAD, quinone]-like [Ruditapes philippinarum]